MEESTSSIEHSHPPTHVRRPLVIGKSPYTTTAQIPVATTQAKATPRTTATAQLAAATQKLSG